MTPQVPLLPLLAGFFALLLLAAGCQQPATRRPATSEFTIISAAKPAAPPRTRGVIQAIEVVSVDRQIVVFKEDATGAERRVMVIAIPDDVRQRMIGMRMVFVDSVDFPEAAHLTAGRQVVRIFDDAFQFDFEPTGTSPGGGS